MCNGVQEDTRRHTVEEKEEEEKRGRGRQTDRRNLSPFQFVFFLLLPPWKA